jgi:kynurenine formamidase
MTDFDAWITELGSRRPFGDGDRLGTANYIDRAARLRAAVSVLSGDCLTLARPLSDSGAAGASDLHDFALDVSVREGPVMMATEHLEIRCHGALNTHLDALNHIGVGGLFYGGHAAGDPALSSVADLAGHGLFTRGVFADIPASRGAGWVDSQDPVTGDDIERALGATGFETGDALLLYMGRDRYEAAGNDFTTAAVRPGAGASAAEWLADNRVSVLCWDFFDAGHPDTPILPIHRLIWAVGLLLVDNCDLSAVGPALSGRQVKVGALSVSPIGVPDGTGCAVTPMLIL